MPISISAVVAFALLIANFSNLGPGPPVYGAVQSRPQEPKPPFPYDEQEVVYENKKDGVRLAGTLTDLPPIAGEFTRLKIPLLGGLGLGAIVVYLNNSLSHEVTVEIKNSYRDG